jgi:ABC-2 type transport system permease protein
MAAATTAQAATELRLTLRRGESVLLTILIPVGLLAFFSTVDVLTIDGDAVDFVAPGVLALAVMSTAMVNLAIATGFERQYGVLKRLGVTPLGRPALLAAKTLTVLGVLALQTIVLVPVALALGWDPSASPLVVVAAALGTVAFAGIGLLMAGTLRGEVTLAAANGLYLALLLTSGMVVPLDELPSAVREVAELLPAAALADVVRATLGAGEAGPAKAWWVLAAWAVAAPSLAARLFRWE